jgi:hypothetical protein
LRVGWGSIAQGPMELLDTAPSDDEDEAVGAGSFSASAKIKDGLPGAGAKGKPAVRTKCVRLSPTGRCARCLIPSIPATGKPEIKLLGFGTGRQWPLNEGQRPRCRGVRVHARTGYNHVWGVIGRVRSSPIEFPTSRD